MDLLDESWEAERMRRSMLDRIKELEQLVADLYADLDIAYRRINDLEEGCEEKPQADPSRLGE